MTKTEFYNLLSNRSVLSVEEKAELEKMCAEYPYFSSPHIMLARSAKLSGSLTAEKKIQTASIYIGDRSLLFDELSEDALRKTILKIEEEIEMLPSDKELDKETEALQIQHVSEDVRTRLSEENEETVQGDKSSEESEENVVSDNVEPKMLTDEYADKETDRLSEQFDPLEVGYISEAVSRSIELEVSEAAEEEKETPEDLVELSDFAQWLAKRAIQLDYLDPETSNISINDENLSPDLSVEGKESLIIDKFIETNPEITKGKLDEVEVGDIAATSIVDNEEFITETLAEIYAKQGLKDKARRAFELLSLKYPEKSAYFAGRFEALMASRDE